MKFQTHKSKRFREDKQMFLNIICLPSEQFKDKVVSPTNLNLKIIQLPQ